MPCPETGSPGLAHAMRLDVLRPVRQSQPDLPVLVLTGYPQTQFGIQGLRAGASGFIGIDTEAAELVRAPRPSATLPIFHAAGLR